MNGKKHPLTFFREQNEARIRNAQVSTSVTPADTVPQKAVDKANKFNDIKDSSAGKKSAKAFNKLNKIKSKYPNWSQEVTFANGAYKLK